MFRRNLVPVWIGILCVTCAFLMGQEPWATSEPTKLKVYDADGQYLGILVNLYSDVLSSAASGGNADIFIPSLRKLVRLVDLNSSTDPVYAQAVGVAPYKFYETTDCSGPAYFLVNAVLPERGPYEYFITPAERGQSGYYVLSGPATTRNLLSEWFNGECWPENLTRAVVSGYEVEFPFDEPVSLPLGIRLE